MAMIEFKNVSKWYGGFQVLKDCTTKVEKGEVIVVCGPSGSGKSTLIKCVNGLETFQQGEIVVNGVSVGAPKPALPPAGSTSASRPRVRSRWTRSACSSTSPPPPSTPR